MKLKLRFRIVIHVWGGFGSQLLGLSSAIELTKRFPNRKIRMVFHSSGITERLLEIPIDWLSSYEVVQSLDYRPSTDNISKSHIRTLRLITKTLVSNFAAFIGVLSRLEDGSLDELKPWILQLRGHYTNIALSDETISKLASLLKLEDFEDVNFKHSTTIHLRLGDLVGNKSKSHIDISRLSETLLKIDGGSSFEVFSDSTASEVKRFLGPLAPESINWNSFNISPIETIQRCFSSNVFLGTNSKLSIWIAIFRANSNLGDRTYLPFEMQRQIIVESHLMHKFVRIKTY
jgi:hypothetical protein